MDDRSFSKDTRGALVPQKKSRAVAKGFSVQVQLGRLSQGGKAIAGAIPAPIKTASRHSIRFGGRATAVFAIAFLLAVSALYVRLLNGPISFAFLVPTLERKLNAQLQGYSFRVGDAILRLANDWGLEFRLADVSIVDEFNHEIAKAPLAAVDVAERSLFKFALAASQIDLIGPKVLIFNLPGKGLTLTAEAPNASAGWAPVAPPPFATATEAAQSAEPPEIAGVRRMAQQALNARSPALPYNPAPFLSSLFAALEKRDSASSALKRIGLKDATIYFASASGVTTWRVDDFHIDLDEKSHASALTGELTLQQGDATWRGSFRAVDRRQEKRYSLTAWIQDIVPRDIWRSVQSIEPLKLFDLPVSGQAHFDIGHDGELLGGEADIKLGSGRFFVPFDKHPARIDQGTLKVAYDKASETIRIKPFELRWDDSVLDIAGTISRRQDPRTSHALWSVDLDGIATRLGAPQYAVLPMPIDSLKIAGAYDAAADSLTLNDIHVQAGRSRVEFAIQASQVRSGGGLKMNGTASPMQLPFLKAIWPAFIANGAREYVGLNVPSAQITGATFSMNLSGAELAELNKGREIPDGAFSLRVGVSGAKIYHIKGLPPIQTKDSVVHVSGQRVVYDIAEDGRIETPNGRPVSFTNGQLIVTNLRADDPDAEVRFQGAGEVASVLELLDQPPLGYVKAVGFKPNFVNGQVQAAFQIKFPMADDLKFSLFKISGKSRVFDLRSNSLPGGFTINGGAVNFDVSDNAISANGEMKVNNAPVSVAWQRFFDAPPEKQPTLRLAAILNEKARDDLGLNVNHIVKGDLPVALGVAMQRDGPPRLFMEANLTNTDVFLTAIGWRKPPGQKATVTFDLSQRPDNYLVLDRFAMVGDGLAINGRLLLNDKHRIAGFAFPEFSTNALTQLSINGELTPQNVLKVQAKGASYDGRQFFRSLLNAGKIADNEPAPLKDEPGLDLNVEIETLFGYYDASVKSVIIDAKRRGGKLTSLEVAGRLNGEAPVAVHVEQRGGEARILVSDATDAGSAFRLVGFYSAMRGGAMNLRVNLDGAGGADKTGVLDVRRFAVAGDQIIGRVVSEAEREGARYKPEARNAHQFSSESPLQFDRMVVPFSVGANQFQLHDAAINGPVLGATLRGRIDFGHETLALSGTYVPLYGFNAVLGGVPLIGDILNGRENEGVFGITFAVQGRTSNPDVVVNPVSMLAPGFLRQIFEFENVPPQPAQQRPATQFGG
ncbi:MAG: AsmA-like C-terminal region-containing protein [Rhodomicrobium sp.]